MLRSSHARSHRSRSPATSNRTKLDKPENTRGRERRCQVKIGVPGDSTVDALLARARFYGRWATELLVLACLCSCSGVCRGPVASHYLEGEVLHLRFEATGAAQVPGVWLLHVCVCLMQLWHRPLFDSGLVLRGCEMRLWKPTLSIDFSLRL